MAIQDRSNDFMLSYTTCTAIHLGQGCPIMVLKDYSTPGITALYAHSNNAAVRLSFLKAVQPLYSAKFKVSSYLGNFSGRTRGAVSVREGQGVVLMCSPPPHAPGFIKHAGFEEYLMFHIAASFLNFLPNEKLAHHQTDDYPMLYGVIIFT
ncbi:UNVERIFIED_CONTAM: hypothetical protein FKN15_032870 [Acipenser sinensis]